ncbi:MAG: prepilin-type N-terminal cleavage/methylation domain-containing protein [Patescibacteria group bacterium]
MKKSARGFTLIEMLVVLAVMGIMATIVFVQLDPHDPVKELDNSQRTLGVILQTARNYALSGKVCPACTGTVLGYGVFVVQNPSDRTANKQIKIYADVHNASGRDRRFDYGVDNVVEEYVLDNQTYVNNCGSGDCDIFFSMYQAQAVVSGLPFTSQLIINLKTVKDPSLIRQIYFNGLTSKIE